MLQPIYDLLFNKYRLDLKKDELVISYQTYQSTDLTDMQAIVDQQLAPGKILEQKIKVYFSRFGCIWSSW